MNISKKQRNLIKQIYGGKCTYCGDILGDKWHVDHFNSIRRNGDGTCENPENDHIGNLVPACVPCNLNKKSLALEDWRDQIKNYENSLVLYHNIFNHAKRFGLIEFTNKPVVFYFEKLGKENSEILK